MKRFGKLLRKEKTSLLIIDIQKRILPVILNHQTVVENTLKLIKGFKILSLPVYYTEQYPKGLGNTVEEIQNELNGNKLFEKMSFSCSGADNLFEKLKSTNQIVITGIETHVCVQQTVLDLLENNFQVNIAADAVSSRKETDHRIALERMKSNGAEITTTESILFELLEVSGTDSFKQVSKLVK
ncbi:MAG TPA: hydrolase [Ignavibacteriaceae bacterium]